MRERIAVGMSGGVDSSTAALLLRNAGYDVVGITLSLVSDGADENAADAKRVADVLGIEHHVLDLRSVFRTKVTNPFIEAYLKGQTPNPCVLCNREIKFGEMLRYARSLGADKIATGHYARTVRRDGHTYLYRTDSRKDQSYFLCMLLRTQIEAAVFPLDGMDKEAIRRIAQENGLPTADRKDSQDICFIPDGDYASFILKNRELRAIGGDFVDTDGNVLGRHQGILHYTVGQRKGLGAFGKPMFVTQIDPIRNRVVLGEEGRQYAAGLIADDLNWIAFDIPPDKLSCQARIRFRAAAADADVSLRNGQAIVHFKEPQRSVTPGQTIAFYDGDLVLGGGTIRKALQGGAYGEEAL